MAFCMNCGTKLPDGAKFCLECGTPLGQLGEASPAATAYAKGRNAGYAGQDEEIK